MIRLNAADYAKLIRLTMRGTRCSSSTSSSRTESTYIELAIVIIQQWLFSTGLWDIPECSLVKGSQLIIAALGAAMRKLVQICFGILKHQQPYQPQTT